MLIFVIKLILVTVVIIALFQSLSSLMNYDYLKKKLIATEVSSVYTSMAIIPINTTIVYSRDNLAQQGYSVTLSGHKISATTIKKQESRVQTTSFWTPYPKQGKISGGHSLLDVSSKVTSITRYDIKMPQLIQKINPSGDELSIKSYDYVLTPGDSK